MTKKETVRKYISSLMNPEKKQYAKEVMEYLEKSGRRVAYHAFCTDGLISATLLKIADEGDIFIPLDYSLINDKIIGPYLSSLEWYAIIDLKPFNSAYIADLFVDHHISVLGEKFNAKRIHFETGESGPSAAFVLWKYLRNRIDIPSFMTLLVEMSKITDTASYKFPAPINHYEKQSYEFTGDEIGSERFQNAIWDLQDALTFINKTLKPNNHCLELLSEKGLSSLLENDSIVKRINKHRNDRKKTLEFAESLTPTSLTAIINPRTRNIQDVLVHWLSNHGAKVVAILKEDPYDKTCSVSLRQSKKNTKQEKLKFRLDNFAKLFSEKGGGHIEAAGSHIEKLEKGIEIVKTWGKEKSLEVSIVNVETILSK